MNKGEDKEDVRENTGKDKVICKPGKRKRMQKKTKGRDIREQQNEGEEGQKRTGKDKEGGRENKRKGNIM